MSPNLIPALALFLFTTGVAIYAIWDARSQVKKTIKLQRDLAYLKIKNDTVWEFIDPTESTHSSEIAKGLHEFGLLAQALNPEWSPETIKSAVENETLQFAEELVKTGKASWKAGLDLQKVRRAIDDWRADKNGERVRRIMS